MVDFQRVGLVYKPKADAGVLVSVMNGIARVADRHGLQPIIHHQELPEGLSVQKGSFHRVSRQAFGPGLDMVIVLGGDGTLLSLTKLLGNGGAPIFGVNLGHLGFLTEIKAEDAEPALESVLTGHFVLDERLMLDGRMVDAGGEVVVAETVLNDVVVNKAALARIMDLNLTINGRFASDYKSDGLIVATPTGSTAYSLAAGGAIVFPNTHVLAITPICPHSLTNRPLVIDADAVIEITLNRPHENVYVTFDGQRGYKFFSNYRLEVRRSERMTRLIKPEGTFYFDVLKEKLKWGER